MIMQRISSSHSHHILGLFLDIIDIEFGFL
jgi:hypothetical protein